MSPSTFEMIATGLFAIAVLHTFFCSRFQHFANRLPEGSIGENLFHLLGEVEIVFGLWAGIFTALAGTFISWQQTVDYLNGLNFSEPLFVFTIMTVAATRPIIHITRLVVLAIARILPLPATVATFFCCLVIGPLLGSFITEPAAMTVTAFLLRDFFFQKEVSQRLRYLTLAVLLVNVSIGGVLTHFAAPPVLMVAGIWHWDSWFMLQNFGWRAVLAVIGNAGLLSVYAFRELRDLPQQSTEGDRHSVPFWLSACHVVFLAMIVFNVHHTVIFTGLGLFFLGFTRITAEHQSALKIRESLLVAFFLGGLVVFGGLQKWWLQPLIGMLQTNALFFSATALTAITDNAAVTYLGAQIPGVTESFKYALVAGAVTGGGLTVIANAPNPVAFSILQETFGADRIGPQALFVAAIPPTVIAIVAFWLIP